MRVCIQVNLQPGFGGGEVYTAAFTEALAACGVSTHLIAHADSPAWYQLQLPAATCIDLVRGHAELAERFRNLPPSWVVCHTYPPKELIETLRRAGHYVTAFVHMPLHERSPEPLRPFDLLLPVSAYVRDTLLAKGLSQTYGEPMYGIALIKRSGDENRKISKSSCYDWDLRKFRERLLSWVEPIKTRLEPTEYFERRSGVTLGIVSRLTPIKQFPALFEILAPVLSRFPDVNLEIFGAGGYTSVRDLRQALAPIRNRVRFWGHQSNVQAVYAQLDALLTGLPEKEALGLNVIEAQACGLPVLAPDAPPFTETVVPGVTGLLYQDPRQDGGAGFGEALSRLVTKQFIFDADKAKTQLDKFSLAAFTARCGLLCQNMEMHLMRNSSK